MEGTNVVQQILNGKKYKRNAMVHYPFDGGVVDQSTGYRVFFHAHRKKEYGHFHTFFEKPDGELIHLVMVSMDKKGYPIKLSTVNRWVTDETYVNASEVKQHFLKFNMDSALFPDPRIGEFVSHLFKEYSKDIQRLLEQRDETIKDYVKTYAREPFEDRSLEILSTMDISVEA